MLEVITYLLPMKSDAHSSSDFRPIACLPTTYRLHFLMVYVSHDYLINILKAYEICSRMVCFLGHAMSFWGPRMKYFDCGQPRVTRFLRITNGIFQGDSFSAMWFCLALNPLSRTINNTFYGYTIGRDKGGYKRTHLLFMDDLKLYVSSGRKLQSILDITQQFSNDIGMEFGMDKCRKVHLVRLTYNWDMRMRLSSKR